MTGFRWRPPNFGRHQPTSNLSKNWWAHRFVSPFPGPFRFSQKRIKKRPLWPPLMVSMPFLWGKSNGNALILDFIFHRGEKRVEKLFPFSRQWGWNRTTFYIILHQLSFSSWNGPRSDMDGSMDGHVIIFLPLISSRLCKTKKNITDMSIVPKRGRGFLQSCISNLTA
jgi:hypothetical protein